MTKRPSADEFLKSIRECLKVAKIGGKNVLYFPHKCILEKSGLKDRRSSIYTINGFLKAITEFSKRRKIKYIISISRSGNRGSNSVSYLISPEYENIGWLIIKYRMLSSYTISVREVTDDGLELILQIHSRSDKSSCKSCSFYNNSYCELHKIPDPERDDCKCYMKKYKSNPELDNLLEEYVQLCRETYRIGNY